MYNLKITIETPEDAVLLIAIFDEMKIAKAKHPIWPEDVVSQAAIVMEEAGEVIREANHIREGHGNFNDLRKELIQTAGTCIRMLKVMNESRQNAVPVANLGAKVKGQGLAAYFPEEKRRFTNDNL